MKKLFELHRKGSIFKVLQRYVESVEFRVSFNKRCFCFIWRWIVDRHTVQNHKEITDLPQCSRRCQRYVFPHSIRFIITAFSHTHGHRATGITRALSISHSVWPHFPWSFTLPDSLICTRSLPFSDLPEITKLSYFHTLSSILWSTRNHEISRERMTNAPWEVRPAR